MTNKFEKDIELNEQNYSGRFSCYIGGLSLNVEHVIDAALLKAGSAEYMHFVCPASPSKANIYINMESAVCPYDNAVESVIYKAQLFRVQTSVNGFKLIRFCNKQPQTPFLVVNTDNQFSRFHYCFYSDSDEPLIVNPYNSAADAFLLQYSFINYHGLIIHAGGGSIQGKGIVFAGTSGAGKSTLSELLSASPNNRLYSDERLVVRSVDEQWNVWGTPWQGTGSIARNENAPLSALVFLRQAGETQITQLSPSAGLHRLLQVVSVPWYSEEWTNKGLTVCESLIQDIPMFELAFRPDQTAVEAVEELAVKL
ncbi:MAG: hypothetical protein SD837_00325 [Candidatus Electrothrix scaldis]|nr:MAG: hypothetical protein SD837_00325 [Candidatus Electrothrix sp. GW3-3]